MTDLHKIKLYTLGRTDIITREIPDIDLMFDASVLYIMEDYKAVCNWMTEAYAEGLGETEEYMYAKQVQSELAWCIKSRI